MSNNVGNIKLEENKWEILFSKMDERTIRIISNGMATKIAKKTFNSLAKSPAPILNAK